MLPLILTRRYCICYYSAPSFHFWAFIVDELSLIHKHIATNTHIHYQWYTHIHTLIHTHTLPITSTHTRSLRYTYTHTHTLSVIHTNSTNTSSQISHWCYANFTKDRDGQGVENQPWIIVRTNPPSVKVHQKASDAPQSIKLSKYEEILCSLA